jgi:hypothetical protein
MVQGSHLENRLTVPHEGVHEMHVRVHLKLNEVVHGLQYQPGPRVVVFRSEQHARLGEHLKQTDKPLSRLHVQRLFVC